MRRTILAFTLLLGASSLLGAQPSELFRSLGPQNRADAGPPDEVGTRRSQRATIALQSIVPGRGRVSARSDVASSILLNLFPDVRLTAELDRLDLNPGDGYSWVGHVGDADNPVFLAMRDGEIAGNISVDGTDYQIRPNGDGTHTVREVDLSKLPPELDPLPAFGDPFADAADVSSPDAMADSGATIDIMVVYTADARVENGGTNGMNALIDLAVTETNASYANSGIVQRLRLVHTAEVSYTESGNLQTDLYAVTDKADGQMDSVHALRDTHGADAVVLLVTNGGAYCGIAWIMYTVAPYLEDSAFSVVDTSCATGYYSFGHELGHNMGARHDRYVDNTDGSPFTYNHGFANLQDRWRTVMAYNSQCSDQNPSVNCTRIPYWSNPNVTYGGDPMGIAEGQAGAADNRKTLNNTAFTFANFRQAADAGPQGAIDAPSTNQSVTMSFTVSGWSADQSAPSGSGIDLVEVRVIPPSGPAIFLGNASLGLARPDIGTLLGDTQFNNSGYSLNVPGPIPPGPYTLRVSARSSVSGDFVHLDRAINILAQTRMWMDGPAHGSSVGFPFTVSGWAFNDGAPDGSGVDDIQVWAWPQGGGSPTFLGTPTLGQSRPDVGSFFGSPSYNNSGFSLTVNTLLAPGWYSVAAYVHTTVSNDFDAMAWAAVYVGTEVIFIDTPQSGATKSSPFPISGWAVDRAAPSGTGIDAVHVWAVPKNGSPAIWVGEATIGQSRPDVGAYLGSSQFNLSGFQITISTLAPGDYTLWVIARSTVTGTFSNNVPLDITIN